MLLSLRQPPETFFTDPLPQPRTLTPSPRRSLLPFLLPTAATLSLPPSSLPRRRRLAPPLPAVAPPRRRSSYSTQPPPTLAGSRSPARYGAYAPRRRGIWRRLGGLRRWGSAIGRAGAGRGDGRLAGRGGGSGAGCGSGSGARGSAARAARRRPVARRPAGTPRQAEGVLPRGARRRSPGA